MSLLFSDIANFGGYIASRMLAISLAISVSIGPLFIFAIAIVILNGFLVVTFALVGSAFLARMNVSSGELEEQKKEVARQAEIMLESARKESFRITEEASKKAMDILEQTKVAKETIEADLTAALQEFSRKESERIGSMGMQLTEIYRNTMESTKQQYGAVVTTATKEMADHAHGSLVQFEEFLKSQTTRYEGVLKQQVQEGFMSAQKDISDYKRESLRKVEEAIYRILDLVAKSVLGKALSLEDKQNLVIHALDEAKLQGFFEV